MMERRFPRDLGSLEPMSRFVAGYLDSRGFDPEHGYTVDLIIEELFTNMVRHGKGGPEVDLALGGEGKDLIIRLRDYGVEPFDPTAAPEVDVDRPIEERRAGGLGIHLTRKLADTMSYEYRDRCSVITVTKRLAL